MRKTTKFLISKRIIILAILGGITYLSMSYFNLSLWYILLFGIGTGVIFGKVFCRWMCPLGFIMELMMGMAPDQKSRQMYQYHKVGCPIAWVQGFLNRISFLKIHFNAETCKSCGICDKQCYIANLEPEKDRKSVV